MEERSNKTIMCSVLFLDIIEYSKKSVTGQISLKERFNTYLSNAIHDVPVADRIILDTGDGAAINFLGDVEDALKSALSMREAMLNEDPNIDPPLLVRIGINLGPVRLVRDINGQPNIVGDGINVAQRVMGFADASQILVSRSYYDAASRLSPAYAGMFHYQGSRTDKHVREHEVYAIGYPGDKTTQSVKAVKTNQVATGESSSASFGSRLQQFWQHGATWLNSKMSLLRADFVQSESKKRLMLLAIGSFSLLLLLGGVVKLATHSASDNKIAESSTQVASAVEASAPAIASAVKPLQANSEPQSQIQEKVAVVNTTHSPAQADLAVANQNRAARLKLEKVDAAASKKVTHEGASGKGEAANTAPLDETRKDSYLVVTCSEGTIVFVDSVQKGKIAATQLTISVLPGKHAVIVTHPVKGLYSQSIEVEAGKTVHIKPNYCD